MHSESGEGRKGRNLNETFPQSPRPFGLFISIRIY